MIYILIITTNIKEHRSDSRRARNFYTSLLKCQLHSLYPSILVFCILCVFRPEEVASVSSLYGSASTCKKLFLKVLHILTTGRTLSFAFSKM